MKNNLKNFNSNEIINKRLQKVEEQYRPYSAANYLYNLILKEHIDNKYIKNDCYEEYFIELIWATLDAWNMNSRRARLACINDFKKSLSEHTQDIESLKEYSIEDLSEKNYKSKKIFEKLEELFNKLHLTESKSKIVTFSKVMHFLLPNLIVPIDNRYTANFFQCKICSNSHFSLFKSIESAFGLFASEVNLDDFVRNNSRWCKYKTKIIDNIIIGYEK